MSSPFPSLAVDATPEAVGLESIEPNSRESGPRSQDESPLYPDARGLGFR